MTEAAWIRLVVFVLLLAAALLFSLLALWSPPPPDETPAGRGGLGVDGPEYRRVRRALRDGSPLRDEERERALARARRRLSRRSPPTTKVRPPRERWGNRFSATYVAMLWLWLPPSFGAPMINGWFWSLVLVVLGIWIATRLEYAGRLPGARRRKARAREQVVALENLPSSP